MRQPSAVYNGNRFFVSGRPSSRPAFFVSRKFKASGGCDSFHKEGPGYFPRRLREARRGGFPRRPENNPAYDSVEHKLLLTNEMSTDTLSVAVGVKANNCLKHKMLRSTELLRQSGSRLTGGGLEVMTGSPWPCEWVSRPGGSDGMSAHEVIGETGDSRKGFIDVLCTDTDGNTFIVEMQNARQEHFRERVIYYNSKIIARQAPSGEWDYGIMPTYVVAFLNFKMEKLGPELAEHPQSIIFSSPPRYISA